MEWFSRHADAISIICVLCGCMMWMNARFNDVDRRFSEIDKEVAIIKTVMVLKNIMPSELAKEDS